MSYIGNIPAENYASFLTETFSVSATANYTLSHAVSNENDIRLVINNVIQQPGSGKAYTASGTTLTLTSATSSGDIMYAVYLGRALQTVTPPNASVGTSQLIDGEVTLAKLGADSVNATKIADGSIENEHLNVLAITGQTAETSIADGDTILIHDASASALKKMTKANFVSGIGGTNTPAFLAYVNSNSQSIANNTTVKITNYNTEVFDTDNGFASGQFTVPSGGAGKYFLNGSISTSVAPAVTDKQFNLQIKVGSTTVASNTILRPPYAQFGITAIADVSAGSTISMHMYQDSGSAVTIDGNRRVFFGGFKLIS